MKRLALISLTLFLIGCPGGWRTTVVSAYALGPPPSNTPIISRGYIDEIARRPLILDDGLYARLRSDNPHDLTFDTPSDGPYRIEAWFSSEHGGISIDVSSIALLRDGDFAPLRPMVLTTLKRGVVNEYGRPPYIVCDFRGENAQEVDGLISVPRFSGDIWPPKNYDDSVLCIRMVFDASITEVPPQKRFQLHFRYLANSQSKDVTLHFYPYEYEFFHH